MLNKIEKSLLDLRRQKPLILSFTNFVTMDFVANCLLALGAAPVMSVCEDEIEELVKICSAVYINIGTLDVASIRLSKKVVEIAIKHNKPIIFDPVGAGATKIRTQTARYIAPFSTIIRGNASEIIALGGEKTAATKGVESMHDTKESIEIASLLACHYNTTVIVSGPVDFVTNGDRSLQVAHGSPLMQLVTGMGCALTSIIAAFKAVIDDPFEAGLLATYYFALCGEIASLNNKHPGSFKNAFIDQLHKRDFELMRQVVKFEKNAGYADLMSTPSHLLEKKYEI